jgi:catechol 2,3-dioxygenase-like lactoylglutathione lyase family enzyme
MQFQLRKIGHVVLNVTDLTRAVTFYTDVLGLEVSDRYPDSMVPGGMVFLRVNTDHHGVALVGGAPGSEHTSLNHFAFEVGSLDEVFRARAWLRERGVPIHFEGRRRAGCQIAIEFRDSTATTSRSTGTSTRSAPWGPFAPPTSGGRRRPSRRRSPTRSRGRPSPAATPRGPRAGR